MQLRFYRRKGDNIDDRGELHAGLSDEDLVLRTHSSDRFQLSYALEDLGLELERGMPELGQGQYPAALSWSEPRNGLTYPILCVPDNGGPTLLQREYPLTTLRGSDVYAEALREHPPLEDEGKVFYLAVADDPADDDEADFEDEWDLDPEDEPDLLVNVQVWPTHEPAVDLGGLATLGAGYARPTDLPVLCTPEELERVARAVGDIPAEKFVELGWFLVGRLVRNGSSGDLMIVVERAVLAQHTRSNTSTLVIPPESHAQLAADLEQVNDQYGDSPLGPLLELGWLHIHDLRAIEREEKASQGADGAVEVSEQDADNRFFSLRDEKLHRGNYPAASIALVLDAAACRTDPTDLERCYAAFGTIRGTVTRRGLFLLPRQQEQE